MELVVVILVIVILVWFASHVRLGFYFADLHCDECGEKLSSYEATEMKPLWVRFSKEYDRRYRANLHDSNYLCQKCYRDFVHDEKHFPELFEDV